VQVTSKLIWKTYNNNNNNGYSALGPVWQEPEPSQVPGIALVRCILGKFLGVVCHCFPLWKTYVNKMYRSFKGPTNALGLTQTN
jgi:hypothetical protein